MSMKVLKYVRKEGGLARVKEVKNRSGRNSRVLNELKSDKLIKPMRRRPYMPKGQYVVMTDGGWDAAEEKSRPGSAVKPNKYMLKILSIYDRNKDNTRFRVKLNGKSIKVTREEQASLEDTNYVFSTRGVWNKNKREDLTEKQTESFDEAVNYMARVSGIGKGKYTTKTGL
ncbi:MAG: hypothetical protein V1818_01885 [Candidatus Aenigmatarchaeota archaeon]